jgi:flagellar hook protein FlgE
MSIFGALLTGVSGLNAFSTSLSITSSNIANVSTTAYKASDTAFSTMVAASSSSGSSSTGVVANTQQYVSGQGLFTSTDNDYDLAISGSGFFITSTSSADGGVVEYTRAGDFSTDTDGYLQNASGLYLLGYALTGGTVAADTALSAIDVDSLPGTAEASTKVTLTGNLNSTTTIDDAYVDGNLTSGDSTADATLPVSVYNSQGGTETLNVAYIKTGANTWAYEVYSTASDITGDTTGVTTTQLTSGTLEFSSDGTLLSVDGDTTSGSKDFTIAYDSTAGLSDQTITLNFGTIGGTSGYTQLATTSTGTSTTDGYVYGDVSGVSIGTDGIVTATYSNGMTKPVYQIPLATFSNPDGLKATSGTAYTATDSSGTATITTAGKNGAGTINSSQLEDSTVDLATELTDLITTQRAYSACSKIITTSSDMLDSLISAVR